MWCCRTTTPCAHWARQASIVTGEGPGEGAQADIRLDGSVDDCEKRLNVPSRALEALSIQLSIGSDISRHPQDQLEADHDVRQRFNDFLPDFLVPGGCLE